MADDMKSEDSKPVEAATPRKGGRLKKVLYSLVVVALFFLIFANAIAGAVATSWLNKHGSEFAAEPLSVRSIKVNWLFNGASIRGLTLGNPKGFSQNPFLSVERLDASISLGSLLGNTPTVTSVFVDGTTLRLEKTAEGATNVNALLADLAELEAKAIKEGKKKEPAEPKKKSDKGFRLGELKVTNTALQVAETVGNPRNFQLKLKDLTVTDVVVPPPGTSSEEFLTFAMQGFQLTNPRAAGNAVEIDSTSFQFDTPSAMSGKYHIRKFETSGARIQKVAAADGSDNLKTIGEFLGEFGKKPGEPAGSKEESAEARPKEEAAAAGEPAKHVILDDFTLKGAEYKEVQEIDGTPSVRTISGIELSMNDFVSPAEPGKVLKLKLKAHPYADTALTTVDFSGNPHAPQDQWDLTFAVDTQAVPINVAAPTTPKSAVAVKSGKAFLNMAGTIKQSKLDSNIAMHFDDLQVEANGDSMKSQLKSAGVVASLATLKKPGTNDTIEIKFPFAYDMKGGMANWKEMASTMGSALLKAVTEQVLGSAAKVGDIAKGAGAAVTGAAGEAAAGVTGAAGDAAKGVTGAAGSALGKATGSIGGLFGGSDKKDADGKPVEEESAAKKKKKKK